MARTALENLITEIPDHSSQVFYAPRGGAKRHSSSEAEPTRSLVRGVASLVRAIAVLLLASAPGLAGQAPPRGADDVSGVTPLVFGRPSAAESP